MAGSDADFAGVLGKVLKADVVQKIALPVLAVLVGLYFFAPGFFLGTLFGATAVLASQAGGVLYLWRKIQTKVKKEESNSLPADASEDEPVPLDFSVREVRWSPHQGKIQCSVATIESLRLVVSLHPIVIEIPRFRFRFLR